MIARALRLLVDELNEYIDSVDSLLGPLNRPPVVNLGHIALAENAGQNNSGTLGRVILSLVNLEEEKRLKNNGRIVKVDDEALLSNPPVSLNLYLLFSASIADYETALHRLSQVIEFFQGKFVFTIANSPTPRAVSDEKLADLKLILDLHTLNFEQINDLWGSLGGKQVPFVLYRGRLIVLRRESLIAVAPVISEVAEESSGTAV